MQYFAGTREFQIKEPTAVTIGKFDGLHRGHQKLLREVMRYREKGYKPAVFTFETAPGTLIRGKLQTMITTNEEREENLREAGVEYLVEYPFNQEVAHMDPEQFVAEILVGKMGAKAIVSGPDCHFGYQRKGDAELLRKLAPKYGYEVSIVEKAMPCAPQRLSTRSGKALSTRTRSVPRSSRAARSMVLSLLPTAEIQRRRCVRRCAPRARSCF